MSIDVGLTYRITANAAMRDDAMNSLANSLPPDISETAPSSAAFLTFQHRGFKTLSLSLFFAEFPDVQGANVADKVLFI